MNKYDVLKNVNGTLSISELKFIKDLVIISGKAITCKDKKAFFDKNAATLVSLLQSGYDFAPYIVMSAHYNFELYLDLLNYGFDNYVKYLDKNKGFFDKSTFEYLSELKKKVRLSGGIILLEYIFKSNNINIPDFRSPEILEYFYKYDFLSAIEKIIDDYIDEDVSNVLDKYNLGEINKSDLSYEDFFDQKGNDLILEEHQRYMNNHVYNISMKLENETVEDTFKRIKKINKK